MLSSALGFKIQNYIHKLDEMGKKWELCFSQFSMFFDLRTAFWAIFKYHSEENKKVVLGIYLNYFNK